MVGISGNATAAKQATRNAASSYGPSLQMRESLSGKYVYTWENSI